MSGVSRLALAAAAVFLLQLGTCDAADPPSAIPTTERDLVSDPAIATGVLPNGLHFALMRNSTPKGAVSLRLGINVGSFDEESAQHGIAHFLEHMAFTAGKNRHEAELETTFARMGVAFGRDINADTGLFSTKYQLDLPANDEASLASAFQWLRNVADGTTFAEDAVDRERAVIVAERAYRLTPEYLAAEASDQLQMPGLRSTRKDLIGTPDELSAIRPAGLQTFYAQWYRPDNATLIIVGDLPVEQIERRVRETFGSWKPAASLPATPGFGRIDESRGLQALDIRDDRLAKSISACRVHAPDSVRVSGLEHFRRKVLSQLWATVLNRRLALQTRVSHAPFLTAQVLEVEDRREAVQSCIVALPVDSEWDAALRAVHSEIADFAANGPSENEFYDAISALRASYRGLLGTAATRKSSDLADGILKLQLEGDVVPSPAEAFRAFDVIAEGVSPGDVKAAFLGDWSGAGPFLVGTGQGLPGEGQITSLWNESASVRRNSASAKQQEDWAYGTFGRTGRVASRQEFAQPQFARIVFQNGVILNFKHTDFEQSQIEVRVLYGHGRREIPNRELPAAEFGAQIFSLGGLGKYEFPDLQRRFSEDSWDATLLIRSNCFILEGSTTASGLKTQLQILAAYASDPGFRDTLDERLPSFIHLYYHDAQSDSRKVLAHALWAGVAPDGPGRLPPEEELVRLHMRNFSELLRPALTEAPLEITIVGDIDEASATELAAETFGALPVRSDTPRERQDTQFLRFPDHDLPLLRTTHEGASDIAIVGVIWPLYVATPERRREETALMLLSSIFTAALRDDLRQRLGKTYSPEASLHTPDKSDQGYLLAEVETAPAAADDVVVEVKRIAEMLARGNTTSAQVDAARRPFLATLAKESASNALWASAIAGSSRWSDGLDEMNVLPALVGSITADDVNKAASYWLRRAPIAIIAMPRPAETPQSANR